MDPITENELDEAFSHIKSKAKSTSGLSPDDIKQLVEIKEPLLKVYNNALRYGKFPETKWLETTIFFLYKKGELDDPNNYRSINIQNPLLKFLTCILSKRLSKYAEEEGLLPTFQF